MRKKILFLVIPVLIVAEDLSSLLEFADNNNKIVVSKVMMEHSKEKIVEASKSAYYPTLDVGGYYERDDKASIYRAGDTYSAFATLGVDIYDGGKKSGTLDQNRALHDSSKYNTQAYKKDLQLKIVEDFYNIKSAHSSLSALEDSNKQLSAELDRVKKFYEVGRVTKDDVERLESAYSNNLYRISAMKYQIESLKKFLEIKVGKKIGTLDDSSIKEPFGVEKELSDNIMSLKSDASSIEYKADAINSIYYPKLRLEDTYSVYAYGRKGTIDEELNNQNQLLLTLNIRLYDNAEVSKQKEALLIEKESLKKQIEQLEDEQDTNIELALLKIDTTKAQIESVKSSLLSSISAYETVSKKYAAGFVDYVTYLDALSVKTTAKAQYEASLNNLQIAYATYYYYTNKNIKDFIK